MAIVTVDLMGLDTLIEEIEGMQERASDLTPILAAEGQELTEQVQATLASTLAPLSPITNAIKAREGRTQGRPLQALQDSIRAEVTSRKSLSVFSTFNWAERLHRGGTNARVFGSHNQHTLPARPFLPMDSQGHPRLTDAQAEAFTDRILTWVIDGEIE